MSQINDAKAYYQQAIAQNPKDAQAYNNLGHVFRAEGNLEEAIASYQQAITLNPNYAEAYNNLGNTLAIRGSLEEAIASYQKAVAINPNYTEVHNNLGNALMVKGNLEEAIASYQKALALNPYYAEAYYNLGNALKAQGKLAEAKSQYQQALSLKPNFPEAYNNLGLILQEEGNINEAIACYQKALAINPNYVEAHNNLGNAFEEQGILSEAIACYQKALAINPNYIEAYNNLGNALLDKGDIEEAIACYQQALALNPNYARAYYNLGNAFLAKGELAEAEVFYCQASAVDPNFPEAHKNLGILLLLSGDLKNGFAEYEWRWQTEDYRRQSGLQPFWNSSDIKGKKVLLLCEHGFGDCIQFIRYAPLVAQQGAHITVGCYPELLRLFSTVPGIEQLVTKGAEVDYDYCAPLMSLPYLLGTTLETVPANIPYISPPQPYPITLESPPGTRLKVGIVWAGNPANKNDRNRSCKLSYFLPVLDVPGVAFYSLQKGVKVKELTELNLLGKVQDLSEQLGDFADTAAAIAQLDLVITVDTSVGHLAGSLGKPVWVLLAFAPDWRWMLEREDSPWYPNTRLFRQSQPREWTGVFQRVAVALKNLVAQTHKKGFGASKVSHKISRQKTQKTPIATQSNYQIDEALETALKHHQAGRLIQAERIYRQILLQQPDCATAYNNLGTVLIAQGKLSEALSHYQQAIALDSKYTNAHYNLGIAFYKLGKLEQAIASFRQALVLNPNYADAHYNLSLTLLIIGDLKNGFAEYEWRWQTKEHTPCSLPYPLWDGSTLPGRKILLVCEQGFGDAIQFIRYAPLIAQQGGHVILKCNDSLERLFKTVAGVQQIITTETAVECDVNAPLMSLPHLLGTTLETVPDQIPYLFAPQPYPFTLQAPPQTLLKVGIVWAGNPINKNDRNRSCELRDFLSLFNIPGIAFYSLQKGPRVGDLTQLNILEKVQDLSEKLGDFADTAAAIAQLDLVITVDTAVAHLAGALGKPVWVLLSKVADWRWMLDREDSPWYPTMRLFRQSQLGDWTGVFQRVAVELENWVAKLQENSPQTTQSLLPVEGFNRLKKCRHGMFLYNINDIYIGKSLDLYGEYSEGELELFQQIIQPNDLIVDVGANIGSHTVFFAQAVGVGGTVLAFEPQRLIFQNLCANLALNNVGNTYCYNVALGNTFGSIKMPVIDYSKPNNFGGLSLGDYTEGELVQMITLDSLNLPYCRLIKVDVEGMELQVLEGAVNTITSLQPILYVENDRGEKSDALIRYIDSLGYKMYWHKTPFYNSNNYLQNPENIFGKTVSINMLCFPPSYSFTVGGLEPVIIIK